MRLAKEIKPPFIFLENVPAITSRGGLQVVREITEMGYDCKWTVMGAADIGANHQRDRIWIKATAQFTNTDLQSSSAQPKIKHDRPQEPDASSQRGMGTFDAAKADMAHSMLNRLQGIGQDGRFERQAGLCSRERRDQIETICGSSKSWWQTEPDVGRVADGVASRVDRLKAIGNGQVPLCAATAWRLLSE